MRKIHIFLLNGIILTATSLLMRLISLWFNAYISKKIGTEGMGLYTLVMSIYSLSVTVAIFGMSLACTRLVAEENASGNHRGVKYSVKSCSLFGAAMGTVAAIIIVCFGDFIGNSILKNPLTVISVRGFGICLPFLSVSSILNGYFTAVGRIAKSSVIQFTELFTRIIVISLFLNLIFPKTLEYSCFSVVLGGTIAETMSCLYYLIIYAFDSRRYKKSGSKKGIRKRIFKIAIPVALSSCLKSSLSAIKNILIPTQLKKSGLNSSTALSQYGIIQGMVMPVIMFPSAVILSFSTLILPEFSQLYIQNKREKIHSFISRIFKITLFFSIGISGIFICYANAFGQWIYKSTEAGQYIGMLAPLIPIMYLDFVTDSILKGLNQQVGVVKINIIDTILCIILICFLLPPYSTTGYILVIFISEIINGIMSICMLIRTSDFEFKFMGWILKPIVCAMLSGLVISLIDIPAVLLSMAVYITLYSLFLSVFKCFGGH